jgi:ubiquinone/menaquinone biosynthesis C-methylase UbiE
MKIEYVHPLIKTEGIVIDGFLRFNESDDTIQFNHCDCYDFASICDKTREREFYDDKRSGFTINPQSLLKEKLLENWNEKSTYQVLLESIGDVNGKTILLLGNGSSTKEILFLLQGAKIVYTDISLNSILKVKDACEKSEFWNIYKNNIIFQAVDARNLPYKDASFDIIYGCAFVHHLSDLNLFLTETYRCLKKGGYCIFLDAAYTKWWQFLKSTILKPLQLYVHSRNPISPEDWNATKRGGYKKNELDELFKKRGYHSTIYKRVMLFEELLGRGAEKLINYKSYLRYALIGRKFDKSILGKKFISNHGMMLVWGAEK